MTEAQTEPQEFTLGTIKMEPKDATSAVVKSEPPDGASNTGSDSGFSSFMTTISGGSTEDLSVKEEMHFPPPEGDVPFMHHVLHLRGMGPRFHGFRGWLHHVRGMLLPTKHVVRGKVMFSQVSVILFRDSGERGR